MGAEVCIPHRPLPRLQAPRLHQQTNQASLAQFSEQGKSFQMTPEQSNLICREVELKVNCAKLILIQIKPFISLCISTPHQIQSLLQLPHSKHNYQFNLIWWWFSLSGKAPPCAQTQGHKSRLTHVQSRELNQCGLEQR